MCEKRISIFTTDAYHRRRRMLDLIIDDGTPYIELMDRRGNILRTTVDDLLISYEELKRKSAW